MNFATGQEKYIFIIKKLSSFFYLFFKSGGGKQLPINLDNFKRSLSRGLGYFLVPATFDSKNSQPEIADEKYWIKKNNIKIIEAWKIGENDKELMAISADDTPIIPTDIANAPVIAALKKKFH